MPNDTIFPERGQHTKLPDTRESKIHKFAVGNIEGYLIASIYPDGQLGEIFIVIAREGSFVSGMANAFALTFSLALQHGTPLGVLINKLRGHSFEGGYTNNLDIPEAYSIIDYIVRYIDLVYNQKES